MISKIHYDLLAMKDEKVRNFNAKIIVKTEYEMIGIRLPDIRNYAKKLMKENILHEFEDRYYEEVLLHGICIGLYKCDFKRKIELIEQFLPLIDDWGICDSFVPSLKDIAKHRKEYLPYVRKYLKDKREFYQRFGFVVLLDYYKDEEYKNEIFHFIKTVKYNGYYSKMASAWLLSYMFMFSYEDAITYITENTIDTFVLNKGIQKAIDSYRISDVQKDELKNIRNSLRE